MSTVEQGAHAPEVRAALAREDIAAILALRHQYEEARAACIEALQLVQQRHGWISDERLRAIAILLEMAPEELESVATFFNLIFRRPVGRHVIKLCDSVSCWIMGHEQLRQQLEQDLAIRCGQTSADGRFTLLPIVCLGHCDHAPALMVDDDLHGNVDPAELHALLERYR